MKKNNNGKKAVVLLLVLVLLLGGVIGGTIAYLTDKTPTITNTFTSSDVSITLTENVPANKTEKMVPGKVIPKDPTVTVSATSEDCYLFIKIDEGNGVALAADATANDFISYSVDSQWTALDGVEGVYYIVVDTDAEKNVPFSVLADDQVLVLATVTKAMMNNLTAATYPTLTFTAYAIQFDYLENVNDAYYAWTLIN